VEGEHRGVHGLLELLGVWRPVVIWISNLEVEEVLALVVWGILLVAVKAQALSAAFRELRRGQTEERARWWWWRCWRDRHGRLRQAGRSDDCWRRRNCGPVDAHSLAVSLQIARRAHCALKILLFG
jgi:hypothetical protein